MINTKNLYLVDKTYTKKESFSDLKEILIQFIPYKKRMSGNCPCVREMSGKLQYSGHFLDTWPEPSQTFSGHFLDHNIRNIAIFRTHGQFPDVFGDNFRTFFFYRDDNSSIPYTRCNKSEVKRQQIASNRKGKYLSSLLLLLCNYYNILIC